MILSAFLIALGCIACSSTKGHRGGTATVEFVHPEKYSDIELRNSSPERTRNVLLPDLEKFVQKQAALHIPAGDNLHLRITNIDDAGWIRPVGPTPRRVVRQVQPARVDFEYTITDAAGTALDSGCKTLSDTPVGRMDNSFDTEQLPLVKRMLGDWITQMGLHEARKVSATGAAP
jgi:hypothetical protein